MKTYKQFITELRSHPELNPHRSLTDNLEKYKDDPDVFITYTSDLGSKKGGAGLKVGINPSSGYNTPLGIYTYPLKEAWKLYNKGDGKLKVPFAGEKPNVVVLRRTGKHINNIGVDYTSKDWDSDISTLSKHFVTRWSKMIKINAIPIEDDVAKKIDPKNVTRYIFAIIVSKASQYAQSNTIGGRFWNVTRILSLYDIHMNHNKPEVYIDSHREGYTVSLMSSDLGFVIEKSDLVKGYSTSDKSLPISYNVGSSVLTSNPNAKSISLWNQIFKLLGYESIADRRGKGIIHEAEPIQAVFFSSKGYKVIDAFDNVGTKNDLSSSWAIIGIRSGDTKLGKDASYQISSSGNILWAKGTWEKGTWEDGTWMIGSWKDGTWNNGIWNNGIWEKGTWKDGTWNNGEWRSGIWNNGTWRMGLWRDGTWKTGSWNSGTWKDGTWEGGIWNNGTWKGGDWKGGDWKGGTWKDGTWEKGIWIEGVWEDGFWDKGTWNGGTWKNGVWEDGVWKGGIWKNGVWKRGSWLGGTWKGGTWKGGYDKDGKFHKAGDSPDKWSK